ncbi:MAG: Flp pilus assembly complex ATPase component TadA [Candidatus Riflebacteria bacterium]|nr:Flp pilus assembly complex ATPase component TadA [Candidatus Riflebacteria bacterium]
MEVVKLIEKVYTAGGNELHLKVGTKPMMRRNKHLIQLDVPVLVEDDMKHLFNDLLKDDHRKEFEEESFLELNFWDNKPCNYRLSLFRSQGTTVATIKLIESEVPSIDKLQFPQSIVSLLSARQGLLIFAGPTRSGITTLMASAIQHINETSERHIHIIEDPVEYRYKNDKSYISQRQLGKDLLVIEQGINFAKRMDVDVLVIGDIKREIPFFNIIEYMMGGHMVILCMPTLGVTTTLEKFVYSFDESRRNYIYHALSEHLLAVMSQGLIENRMKSGVVPVHELLLCNTITTDIFSKGKLAQIEPNMRSAGPGSVTFAETVKRLITQGTISEAEGNTFLGEVRNSRQNRP